MSEDFDGTHYLVPGRVSKYWPLDSALLCLWAWAVYELVAWWLA